MQNDNIVLQAEKINKALASKGEIIRKKRGEIYQRLLAEQREGKDYKVTKQHLDFLDEIIGDKNEE